MTGDGKPRCGDAYRETYRTVRAEVLACNEGHCSFCGLALAIEAHHSSIVYPCGSRHTCCEQRKVHQGDLVGLCSVCHELATTLRRFSRAGGSVFEPLARFKEVIAHCGIESVSEGLAPSSLTTARPDSTPGPLPTSRKPRSSRRRQATGPRPTRSDSANLIVSPLFYLDQSGAPTLPTAPIRSNIEYAGPQTQAGSPGSGRADRRTRWSGSTTTAVSPPPLRNWHGTVNSLWGGAAAEPGCCVPGRGSMTAWPRSWVEADDELVDQEQLVTWLDISGRRLGLGDWRPQKSGQYGGSRWRALRRSTRCAMGRGWVWHGRARPRLVRLAGLGRARCGPAGNGEARRGRPAHQSNVNSHCVTRPSVARPA